MKLSQRLFRDLSLLLLCLLIFGLGAWLVAPTRSPKVVLKISAGSAVGTRHALASQLKEICRAHKLDLEIVATEGSEHALRELNDGKLDLAFIQGGMVGESYSHVTQVAPLHLEPLHLLVKPDVADLIEKEGLGALGGHTITKNARPPLDLGIMESAPEFDWHPGSRAFIAHHKPLIAGAFVELTANGLAIAGSVLGGSYVFIQWLRRRRQHGSETEFRTYLNSVLEVERQLLAVDSQGVIQVSDLVKLHQRLIELKREVAQRFFNGELEGQALMLGFMTLTNDVRNHIARLMLHERDNVEELARHEHQSVESLWHDRLTSTDTRE